VGNVNNVYGGNYNGPGYGYGWGAAAAGLAVGAVAGAAASYPYGATYPAPYYPSCDPTYQYCPYYQ
jgi:hypothetical protein